MDRKPYKLTPRGPDMSRPKSNKTAVLWLYIEPELKATLKRMAARNSRTISDTVARLIVIADKAEKINAAEEMRMLEHFRERLGR